MSHRAEKLYRQLNEIIVASGEPAPCEDYADLYFSELPAGGQTSALQGIERANTAMAKVICHSCPAKAVCAAYALESVEEFGIWGGTTFEERKLIRKLRA
jgi:hypothetical protein